MLILNDTSKIIPDFEAGSDSPTFRYETFSYNNLCMILGSRAQELYNRSHLSVVFAG